MRVVMLGQYPLDEDQIVGGVEAVVVPLIGALARFDDLDLQVITCQPGVRDHKTATRSGLPLHVLRRKRLGRLTFHIRDVAGIQRALERLTPSIVHAHGMGIYAAAATASPYPHVVTTHGLFFREAAFASGLPGRLRGFMDGLYEQRCLGRVRNLISISPYVDEELVRGRHFHGRVYSIENPVDDLFFRCTSNGERATILYAGRVIPRKGLLDLLRALVLVRKALPEAQLRVAGEAESSPEYVQACHEFVGRQGLGAAVTFLGSLRVSQLADEYGRCSVVALPSRQETAPVVVAEAMAAGRPVVGARVCGVPYMIEDGKSGLLVEPGDVDGMARALLRILGEDGLGRRMGQRGRELAEMRFRADVIAQQTRQAYLEIARQ